MTPKDIKNIFGTNILRPNKFCAISADDFLSVVGFSQCEPTKESMLDFDGGTKGYKELIEKGNFKN